MLINRSNSFDSINKEFKKKDIYISDKSIEFIKDLFEDNEEVELSYSGVYIKMVDGDLVFEDVDNNGFIIHSDLTECELDNLKIHGLKYELVDGKCVILENVDRSTSLDNEFNRTYLFS